MAENKKINIAIVGGGLAGATLLNALLQHPHLNVDIFESAAEFSERGAGVGLAMNAQGALAEIGPQTAETLTKAGAVEMCSSRLIVASGPDAGTVVLDLAGEMRGKVVHRAAFLSQLLAGMPKEKMHTSKKLLEVKETPDGQLRLIFQDGSEHVADAVIGADGIHGHVRKHVLGADEPTSKPRFAEFWDCRALVPIAKAREVLGKEYFPEGEERQYGWVGNGGFFMHDILDNGATVQCVASMLTDGDWDEKEWKRDLDREQLTKYFAAWDNSPVKDGMIELLSSNPDLKAFAQWHLPDTPTYAKGNVCIMGDAAHALTPWQGAGAGLAIEDAMILSHLLGRTKETCQIIAAFKAYDQVRRPRAQRIVATSKEAGIILCGKEPGVGLDVNGIRGVLANKWDFIFGIDFQKHKGEALEALRSNKM